LPEDVFKQEYMAEFLEDSAGVFRGVDACLFQQEATEGTECARYVVIGCDIAKHTDWTVLIAMDAETGRCFAMERFNQLDWPIQKERIVTFARKWRGRVILDATGIGDPIYDDLKRVLPDIEPFRLTQGSKSELIQRLRVAIEQRQVGWPGGRVSTTKNAKDTKEREGEILARGGAGAQWDVLTAEMKRYEYDIGPSGGISYSAPSGFHDDCVMALALANHRRWESSMCGNMLPVAGGKRRRLRGGERCVEY